jgi:hypothetical protein
VNQDLQRSGGWLTRLSARGHPYHVWVWKKPLMPRIRDEFLDSVIYLYPSEKDADEGARAGGSGFLVGVPIEVSPRTFWFIYAVTNKHVIENGNPIIRVNTERGKDIILTDEREWSFHPNGDDIAVCQIAFDPAHHKINFLSRSSFLDLQTVKHFGIGPGDDVFVVGRFINHEGKQRNLPTARFGCIAQMPWEPIRQDTGFDQESFLVEIRSIGGYSGSPVFVHIGRFNSGAGRTNTNWEYGPWLLGIDWGHINDWTPVCDASRRPINPAQPKSMQVTVNTGMMAVVPAWKLAEMLDCDEMADQRTANVKEIIEKEGPPPATSD